MVMCSRSSAGVVRAGKRQLELTPSSCTRVGQPGGQNHYKPWQVQSQRSCLLFGVVLKNQDPEQQDRVLKLDLAQNQALLRVPGGTSTPQEVLPK